MEDLFESTSRYRDLFNEELALHLAPLTPGQCPEIALLPGKEPRDILACHAALDDDDRTITFQQFHAFCGDKIVWMTPDIFVIAVQRDVYGDAATDDVNKSWRSILHPNVFSIQVSSTGQGFSVVALNRTGHQQAEAVATCDFLVHLLARNSSSTKSSNVRLQSYLPHILSTHPDHQQLVPPVSAAAFEYLFLQQQSQTTSPTLELINFFLPSEHWNALSTVGDSDKCNYKIRLLQCRTVTHSDCHALMACLQSNRGPTSLTACDIPVATLAAGLIGNARLQSWTQAEATLASTTNINSNQDMEHLLHALSQNQGLESIQFASDTMILSSASSSNNNKGKNYFWNLLWDSVQHHPKLTKVSFGGSGRDSLGSDNEDPHPSQGTAMNMTTTTTPQPVALATAAGNAIGIVGNAAAETTTNSAAAAITVTTSTSLSARRKRSRTRTLATKLQSNTILQSIQFADVSGDSPSPRNHRHYVDLTIWKATVHPILERNVFQPRIAALQEVTADSSNSPHGDCFRQKLLLPAVCANSSNPNVLYMILSSAADIVADSGSKSCKSDSNSNMTKYLDTHMRMTRNHKNNSKRKAQGSAHMNLGQSIMVGSKHGLYNLAKILQ
jgi:hypothetical protein